MNPLKSIILAFLLLPVLTSHAQVINIEKVRKVTDTIGFAGGASALGSYLENEQSFLNLSVVPDVQYKTEKDLILLIGKYSLSKSEDVDFQNSGIVHLRYNRKVSPLVRMEAFTQVQKDKVNKLNYRYLAGAGPRLKLVGKEKFRTYYGALPMLELEKSVSPNSVFHRQYRWSNYVSFTAELQDYATLFSTSYYQPEFSQFSDYRFFNENTLRVKLNKYLNFDMSTIFNWDSEPPLDAPNKLVKVAGGFTIRSD